jgi:lipopolysaccharide/colanic/teichoic acid biosynthesis glycosyltransferase
MDNAPDQVAAGASRTASGPLNSAGLPEASGTATPGPLRPDSAARRCLDLAVAAVTLAILWPLMLLISVAIKAESRGPVLYRALRVGRDGRGIQVLKFRTMVEDAAGIGPAITARGDPRVTRIGRWLRLTKVDELPQLVNVIRGDMSLVGPRPEDPRYVSMYTPAQRRILDVRPGMTSPASIAYRDEESRLERGSLESDYVEGHMPAKLAIDLRYLEQRTLTTDLGVILRTLWTVLTGGSRRR